MSDNLAFFRRDEGNAQCVRSPERVDNGGFGLTAEWHVLKGGGRDGADRRKIARLLGTDFVQYHSLPMEKMGAKQPRIRRFASNGGSPELSMRGSLCIFSSAA